MNDNDAIVARTEDGRCLLWEPDKPCKLLGTEIYYLHDAFSRTKQPTTDGAVVVDIPPGKL